MKWRIGRKSRDLPFKIMPGEDSSLRNIFLERAIVSERIRLAMGLSLRPVTESVSATEDLEHSVIADKATAADQRYQVCL